jgi:phospholipid/cholesterol/gamma-HCH transport system ATP-binding protein
MGQQHHETAHVDVLDVRYAIGDRSVFDGLTCRFPAGRISVVLGASGAGKSTLLRMIAALQKPGWGEIWVGDQEITCMPSWQARRFRRRIGMLFQGGALLDSMTVFDNVALALREHTHLSEAEIAEEVHLVFDSVGLKDVDSLLPGELSGGMVKSAALARAMVMRPEILLCDEPFSGLDPITERLIEALLVETNRQLGITTIITSHHVASALRMSDQLVYLVDGGALCGAPAELERSSDPRLAEFFEASGSAPVAPRARAEARPR